MWSPLETTPSVVKGLEPQAFIDALLRCGQAERFVDPTVDTLLAGGVSWANQDFVLRKRTRGYARSIHSRDGGPVSAKVRDDDRRREVAGVERFVPVAVVRQSLSGNFRGRFGGLFAGAAETHGCAPLYPHTSWRSVSYACSRSRCHGRNAPYMHEAPGALEPLA